MPRLASATPGAGEFHALSPVARQLNVYLYFFFLFHIFASDRRSLPKDTYSRIIAKAANMAMMKRDIIYFRQRRSMARDSRMAQLLAFAREHFPMSAARRIHASPRRHFLQHAFVQIARRKCAFPARQAQKVTDYRLALQPPGARVPRRHDERQQPLSARRAPASNAPQREGCTQDISLPR